MRLAISSICLVVGVGVAVADATPAQRQPTAPASKAPAARTPATNLAPINLTEIPEQCQPIAKQAAATSVHTALSARISLANCLADVKLAPLQPLDCEASMLEIDEAMQHSFALVDEVIAGATDDTMKIVAENARAELYNQMLARMTATLPPPGNTESAIALHRARKDILDSLLGRWRTEAAKSYERILAIVKATPKLEKNPVVSAAVRIAKERLKLHVAVATPAPQPQPQPAGERDRVITDEEELR